MTLMLCQAPRFGVILLGCLAALSVQGQDKQQPQQDQQTLQMLGGITIRPSTTDAALQDFDQPHWVYASRDIIVRHAADKPADRHQLLLWLPGTRPPNTPEPPPGRVIRGASHEFCKVAATLGYHVIALSYPNSLSASSCNKDAEADAFEKFRLAIIAGGETPHITVSRTSSIENRLIKLLQSLAQKRAREEWAQFLTAEGGIAWEKIAVAGQSQGGGHAALIGIHHKVARVLCFGAPRDYSQALQAPGAWYLKESATPKDRFYAFNHQQDRQGCTPAQLMENLHALKLDAPAPPVKVEESSPPYGGAHILMTNHPGTKVDSLTAHGAMLSPKNQELFEKVWRYMLGE